MLEDKNVPIFLARICLMMLFILIGVNMDSAAQGLTRIYGKVVDAETGESLPFVNISFEETTIGTVSDSDGKFYIETQAATPRLKASFIGYDVKFTSIKIGQSQNITIKLSESAVHLEEVTVTSKKLRYRNKNNPAVNMIKKVIDNKSNNRTENLEFFEYDKYEKVEFDFNNITQKFKDKKIMKNFQMVFDYVDTSEVNGKTYLPIFLRETSSKVYYRKNPKKEIEYRKGQKMTGFSEYFDNQGVSALIDKMYQDVDIYDNNVNVLTQKFVSPISTLGPITYKYYIADTLIVNGEKLFKLSFQPRNQANLAFVGNLFITTDSTYAVKKCAMQLSKKVNINYVEDLFIDQEFEKNIHGSYVLKTDKISIDFNLLSKNGMGMFGKRTVSYRDMIFNKPQPEEIYSGLNKLVKDPNMDEQSEEFWAEARHMDLSRSEQGVFEMVEEVKELPAFKRMMDLLMLIMVGYKDFGPLEVGPVNTFYSWNDVEGFRMRIGGRTTTALSEKWQFETYVAYGFKDEDWKYTGILTRFLNHNPLNAIRYTYQREVNNPGEQLMFQMEDNFLLSIKRGINDKRFYNVKNQFEYLRELDDGLSFTTGVKVADIEPGGILSFAPGENIRDDFVGKDERKLERINTTELNMMLRFAPNEQYYQGKKYRVPIYNKYPVFTMRYDKGFKDVFNSDYAYDRLSLLVFKRTYVSPLGYFDTEVEARKVWGTVPYPLLNIPRANQTYSLQIRSYNLMNFLEFVSDEFVSVQYAHYFNGFFMNKIPLIKELKWRSVITFKGLFGRLTEENDPMLHPELPGLPYNSNGLQATFPLETYVETSIGIANIFNFFRIDVVKRWTQLHRSDIAGGYNIRGRFKIEF